MTTTRSAKVTLPADDQILTEVYEGAPEAGAAVNTMTLDERDGRTALRILVQHASRQARDMHVASGMEDGLQDALDLLEQTAGSLR